MAIVAFGDSFDLYATIADATSQDSYWSTPTGTAPTLVAGRFGGQALSYSAIGTMRSLTQASQTNIHLSLAYKQTAALSGTTLGAYVSFWENVTPAVVCSIVFRSDGAILLTALGPTGTVRATYTGAVPAANTWYQFEFEVIIHPSTGQFNVRRNGNTANDFTSGSINTGSTGPTYLLVGMNAAVNAQVIDDLLWRTDTTAVPWAGDITCYLCVPASDASVTFTHNTGATNYAAVREVPHDAATSYVTTSVTATSDLYGLTSLSGSPATIAAVGSRLFGISSSANVNSSKMQVKSGATTVTSGSVITRTGTYTWVYRTDAYDPNTPGVAWTSAAVNTLQIGPSC